jgi:hypothetical protein
VTVSDPGSDYIERARGLAPAIASFADRTEAEQRMRDLHAVAQQVQGRDDHFENVGRFLLGLDPDPTFL